MAQSNVTQTMARTEAQAIAALANDAIALYQRIDQALRHNSALGIDWGAGSTPAYIAEDAVGNINGENYTRQQISNTIGSLDWIRKLLTNQSMTGSQGDHLGNLFLTGRPLG